MNVPQGTRHLERSVLRAYAAGDLHGPAGEAAEAHLLGCPVCRAQVVAWRAELTRQVEALPLAGELPPLHRPVLQRTLPPTFRRPRWSSLALTGLAALGLGWGVWQRVQVAALRAEQRQVAGWLAQPDVSLLSLQDTRQQPAGRVLVLPSRRVLFVLPPPARGQVYQVWVAANWKRGDPLTPQGNSRRGTFSADVGRNDYVCVSLENAAGPPPARPTQILGWTML